MNETRPKDVRATASWEWPWWEVRADDDGLPLKEPLPKSPSDAEVLVALHAELCRCMDGPEPTTVVDSERERANVKGWSVTRERLRSHVGELLTRRTP